MSKTVEPHVLKQFSLIRQMGSGAYGHVWIYALKKVYDAFRNSIDAQRTYRQVQILYQLDHENIIKLHKVIKSKNNKDLYLVFQFMEADLHSVVGAPILEKMHQTYIFYQLLKGLKYIHSAQLIHRDLKPSNILINSECKAKICDFGLVRSLATQDIQEVVLSQQVATKWYRAPQLLLGSRTYGKAVDMWSLGCIIAQVLIGKPIFAGNSTLNQFQKILQFTGLLSTKDIQSIDSPIADQLMSQIKVKQKAFIQYFSGVDPDFFQLLKKLLEFNPQKRISVDDALNLPLFSDFNSQKIITAQRPIVPLIDDNVRLGTKVYRQRIYEDIQIRYRSAPLKNRINQLHKCQSTPKRQRQKSISKNKKRCISSKKLNNNKLNQFSNQKTQSSIIIRKPMNKSPYLSQFPKQEKEKKQKNQDSRNQHSTPVNSTKLLKKGGRKKLQQMQKKNILKNLGIDHTKQLKKYLK